MNVVLLARRGECVGEDAKTATSASIPKRLTGNEALTLSRFDYSHVFCPVRRANNRKGHITIQLAPP